MLFENFHVEYLKGAHFEFGLFFLAHFEYKERFWQI